MGILDILNDIEHYASTTVKMDLLCKHGGNDEFRLVLAAALDPYRMYYMHKVPEAEPARRSLLRWAEVWNKLLKPMSERTLSGHAARDAVVEMLSKLSVDDGEVLTRIIKKDLRCGVGATLVNKALGAGFVPDFKVQLAAKDPKKAKFPCMIEPKRDGMRVLALISGDTADEVEFLSRGGRPVDTMRHVAEVLVRLYPPGTMLDGEASSGASFEESLSGVKRGSAHEEKPVTYTLFDRMTIEEFRLRRCGVPFIERRRLLVMGFADNPHVSSEHVKLSTCETVLSMDEAKEFHDDCVEAGFEGAMLKHPGGTYDFKRTTSWIKMKEFDTADLKITGYKEGRGKYKGMLGAVTVRYKDKECSVGTGISDAQRKALWRVREQLIDTVVEVRFMRATKKGKTREPRIVKFRSFKGERS